MAEVAIIGAGPVGVFSVFACGQLGLKATVFDSMSQIGGQCSALYPQKPIYDIPAYEEISAAELIAKLQAQAAPFKPRYRLGKTITELEDDLTLEGEKFKAVIIAAGIGRFAPNKPPLAGLKAFEDKSVFYQVIDPNAFAGKKVMILGGGDSAVDWALELALKADELFIVHRRPKFRAAPASATKLEKAFADGSITPFIGYQLHSIDGADGKIDRVILKAIGGSDERSVRVDRLLVFYGLKNDTELFARWGLKLNDGGFAVDSHMQTDKSGVFAVGDAARYEGKQKLILSGFAEAAIAAEAAYKHINGKTPRFEYSTTKGKPGD